MNRALGSSGHTQYRPATQPGAATSGTALPLLPRRAQNLTRGLTFFVRGNIQTNGPMGLPIQFLFRISIHVLIE